MNAQQLLEKAKEALGRNDLDEAEQLYSQVTGSNVDRESEVFKQAVDGIWEVRRIRETSNPHMATGADPAEVAGATMPDWGESAAAQESDATIPINTGKAILPADVGAETPERTRQKDIASRIETLQKQADSYRKNQTRDNYKLAIGCYETILGFELDAEQRKHYERLLDDTRKEYERYLEAFGGLTTARMLEQQEEQLIQIRLLMNRGLQVDDKGNKLAEESAKLMSGLQTQLLRQASEQKENSIKQLREGLINLEISQLDAALRKLDEEIIGHLRGKNIRSSQSPDAPQTIAAITGIRNLLLQQEDIRKAIEEYQAYRNNVEQLRSILERIQPLYGKSEAYFRAGDYENAIAELDAIRSRVGETFRPLIGDGKGWIVNDLYERAFRKWEDVTITRGRQLLLEAKAALDRSDRETAQKRIVEIIGLEPSLKSEELENLRHEAERLQESIGQVEQELTRRIRQASEELHRREFDKAKRTLQGVLSDRPDHKEAQRLMDAVIHGAVNAVLYEADTAVSRRNEQLLHGCLDKLRNQNTEIGEIRDRITRTKLGERIEETISDIQRILNELEAERKREERFQQLLVQAQTLLTNEAFAQAEEALNEATTIKPGDEQVSRLVQEVRFDWSRHLRKEVQRYLNEGNARAAVETLEKLASLGDDLTSINDLRRKAYLLERKEKGKACLIRHDYRGAIEALIEADLRDPEVINDLRTARQKEVERLVQQGMWEDVLRVLEQVDGSDTAFSAVRLQARAEVALKKAEQAIAAEDFDGAATLLQEAERVGYGQAGFMERLAATHRRLTNDRIEKFFQEADDALRARNFDAVESFLVEIERIPQNNQGERISLMRQKKQKFKRVHERIKIDEQEADRHYRNYQMTKTTQSLLEAIRILDNVRRDKELQDEEMSILRETIESKLTVYHRSAISERGELMHRAKDQNLQTIGGLLEANRLYNIVLEMRADRKDAEAEAGIEEVRMQFKKLRDSQADRTKTLLNIGAIGQPRGISLSDVETLLHEIQATHEAVRNIDPRDQRGMSREIEELNEAKGIFERAEKDLRSIYQTWVNQRKDGQFHENKIREDVDRIVGYFQGKGYTHSDLDTTNPNRILARYKKDQEALGSITKVGKDIDGALQKQQQDKIIEHFAALRRAEETFLSGTEFLAHRGVPGIALPQTFGERYPHQREFLSKLVTEIRTISSRAKDEASIDQLRQIVEQKRFYLTLLDQLDHENRFELREGISEEPLDLRKLDEWQKVFESGKASFTQGKAHYQEAKQMGDKKRWEDGIDLFQKANKEYTTAVNNLEGITIEPESPYRAVRLLQEQVAEMLARSQNARKQLDAEKPWLTYDKAIKDALDWYEQARTALRNNEYLNAIDFAQKAMELDPSLDDNARKVIRHARDAMEERKSTFPVMGCVVLLVIAIVLIVLAVLFGPTVWSWFSEIFYPPVAAIFIHF